ncbi:histidine-type phosphatase [Aeromicrobium chenweiae]|uniref:Multiple inositol polyphosphate phosphatase 1 n=1 Tax=Aeromicrobium chenweiae TaxID=2079793 RepID=A0A2S0WMY3_9ACTN|nr:histidine-type phosphatase [Aeromicrobium chenweiae]AWB92662.1 hypothetical protein C3E78_10870 [Aeromicrobium chenweiae]TGN33651.1 hypothetical protein E4L97_00910 [Aeromicrobium chenweiae]
MRFRRLLVPLTVLAVGLPLASATADVSNARYYSNQTTYGNPASTKIVAPPAGYDMFFLETVGRHGSRAMTNSKAEKRALAVWSKASRKGKLTTRGKRFDNDLRAFQKAERKLGYGRLSSIGKDEWRGIGRRTASLYGDFFAGVQGAGDTVAMTTSPVYRTKQSAHYMQVSLDKAFPKLRHAKRVTDKQLLIEDGASKKGRAAIARVERRSSVRKAAKQVLLRLYRPSYVSTIKDPVDAALDVYLLYCIGAGMSHDTNVTFRDYVPLAAAKKLAEVKDAQNFYRYGPGVAGERSSFKQADPVLDDFFSRLDRRIDGGRTAAVFRHSHGEVTMPFAALTKLPRSQQQARSTFTYGSNQWRGYVAGRMAGNVEWAAYRNASGSVLVTVRYNEQPVKLGGSCQASEAGNGYFYRVSQLKKCLR